MRTSPLFLAFAVIAPVSAASAQQGASGHYYLQGVMETGSELLLKPDGRYSWYLTVGSMDQFSDGRWEVVGTEIVLTPDATAPEAEYLPQRLTIGKDILNWEQPGGEHYRYLRRAR
jgi:hypothetical protein